MRNSFKTKDVVMDVPEQTGIIDRQDGEMSLSSGGINKDGPANGGFTPH